MAYGFGLRKIQLLRKYWVRLTMVVRDGGYFGITFKGIPRCNPWRPPVPPDFQRGCGRCHPLQGDSGGSNQGCKRRTWNVDSSTWWRTSMTTMFPSCWASRRIYRGCLTSSPASLTESASGRTRGRQSVWPINPAMRLERCHMRPTISGWQGRSQPSRSGSGGGWCYQSAERRFHWGHYWRTTRAATDA